MAANLEQGVVSWQQPRLPTIEQVDVLVCGGGVAGIGAATAAARGGARVLLVERTGCLGGTLSSGAMAQWGTVSVGLSGLSLELADRLVEAGAALPGPVVPIDAEAFKDVAYDMVTSSGARVMFFTQILDAILDGDTVKGVVVHTKSGPKALMGKVVVDTTGDADVSFYSGVPHVKGRESDGKMRPITLLFRLGNVDTRRAAKFAQEHPECFLSDPRRNVIDLEHNLLRLVGYFPQVEAARNRGELDPECHYVRVECVFADRGVVTINTVRVYGVDGTDPSDLTKAMVEGRKQMHQLINFLRREAPGFENSYLLDSAPDLGVRETRRIRGEYLLTIEDIIEDKAFEDTVGRIYMRHVPGNEVHSPDGREGAPEDAVWRNMEMPIRGFNLPYRCLVPKKAEGLLVAGRCVSATQEADVWTRGQPGCVLMGQAAGTAALLAVREGVLPRHLDIGSLQAALDAQGVDLGRGERAVTAGMEARLK